MDRSVNAKRKRPVDEEEEAGPNVKKVFRGSEVDDEALLGEDLDLDALGDLDEEAIARLVDAAPETEKIDSAGVKRLLVAFEKAYTENTKMREKHADEPSKFVETEMTLHRSLRDLQAIATAPEHYIELLRNATHESLLSLLTHPNTDIVIDVIDVLRDLLANSDSDELEQDDEEQRDLISQTILVLATQLLKLDLIPLVYASMARFDENVGEEKQGVYNALELIENLSELAIEQVCQVISSKTKLVKWLLDRLVSDKFGSFDDVKLYASEILCILAQSSDDIQEQIGKENGIEMLLTVLSKFRKDDPSVAEEKEMIENIFNVLCVSATHTANRALFIKADGLDLVKLLIKSKKYCRHGACKLLNFYLANDLDASARFLDIGGLGTLFTAFMHQTKTMEQEASASHNKKNKNSHKKKETHLQDEEHIVSTIAALLTNFKDAVQAAQQEIKDPSDTVANPTVEKYSGYIERVIVKFAEANCEKLERLVALHSKYFERMRQIDDRIMAEDDEDRGRDEDEENQIYQDRLEAGLFTLQLVDYILAFTTNSMDALKQRTEKLFKQSNSSWSDIKSVLLEYAVRSAAENDEDPESATGETAYIMGLANSISV